MDYRDNEYDGNEERYSGNRKLYCDLCFRRCRGIYHVIEQGDTLYSLGKRYHVTVSDLMRANPYVNIYNLRVGEELCIPVRPQPRMDEEDMDEDGFREPVERMRANDGRQMTQTERAGERGGYAAEEKSRINPQNQFSENEPLRDVLSRAGLTMSDFMEFLTKKMD